MPSRTFVPFITAVQLTDTGRNSPSRAEVLAMFNSTISGDGGRTYEPAVIDSDNDMIVIGWPGNEAWTAPVIVTVGDWVSVGGTVYSDTQISQAYVPLNSVKNTTGQGV